MSIQNQLRQGLVQNQRHDTRTSEGLAKINRRVAKEHQITRDIVTAKFDELHLSRAEGSNAAKKSGRNIDFFGSNREMIMAYLLPLKTQLKPIIERLLTQYSKEVSPQDIMWLNSEFQHLLASAAQEAAGRHMGSTATSFDEWGFSEDTFRSLNVSRKAKTGLFESNSKAEPEYDTPGLLLKPRKRLKRYARPFTFDLPSGKLQLTLLQRTAHARNLPDDYDIRLSFTATTSDMFSAMDIHFTRDMTRSMHPQLCAQLNVFTTWAGNPRDADLLKYGTIGEIDTAFREGRLSPYTVDVFGDVVCIFVSTILPTYFSIHGSTADDHLYSTPRNVGVRMFSITWIAKVLEFGASGMCCAVQVLE